MKKTKFLFSLLMAIVMMVFSPQLLWAGGTKPYGDGSSAYPYQIWNEQHFIWFHDAVNGVETGTGTGVGIHAKLYADIALTSAWTPIGSSSKKYTGTFNGNGKTISGLRLTSTENNVGLFGYVNNATIKDFTLLGTINDSHNGVGSVVGRADGASQILDVKSSVNINITGSKEHIGGIVGWVQNTTTVSGCTYSGALDLDSSTDSNGGIVGYAVAGASVTITNCLFLGSIKTTGKDARVGGILGYADGALKKLEYCFSGGDFSIGATSYDVASIVGCPRGETYKVIKNNSCLYLKWNKKLGNKFEMDDKCDATNLAITIDIEATTGGSVSWSFVNPTSETPTQIKVVATPDDHYYFDHWNYEEWVTGQTRYISPFNCGDGIAAQAVFYIDYHTITVKVADGQSNMGRVSGGGTAAYNSTINIKATPEIHYHLAQWNDGNKNAARTITVTGDETYTASFAIDQHEIKVNVASGQSHMGTVSGGGTYDWNSSQTIIATPNPGYSFVQWNDGSTKATRSINVSGTRTYTATFAVTQYEINVNASSEEGGKTTGSGKYNTGTNITITATANDGYVFARWKEDGDTNSSRQITVTKNQTYTAIFNRIEPKAVLDNGTLTFYYDGIDHEGTTYTVKGIPDWKSNQSITSVVFDPSFAVVRPTSCESWFESLHELRTITDLQYLNTSEVTTMHNMFYGCRNLNKIDLSHFDTSNVTDMSYMFCYSGNLSRLDLSSFNTMNVTDMSFMFGECDYLSSVNLSSFNTTNVTDMHNMFWGCNYYLKSLDLSSFNTTNVTNMSSMFYGCQKLQNLTIGNFNMQKVTKTSSFFYDCPSLNTLTVKAIPFLADMDRAVDGFILYFSGEGKTVNYELDDNSAIYTGTNNLPDATSTTYTRKNIKNQWGTIVVPFEVNGRGSDYDLYTLSSATVDELTLTRVNGTIPAGTPALICLKEGLAGNYDLTLTAASNTVSGLLAEGSSADGLQLAGTYATTGLAADDYFIANNKFWRAGDMSATVKAAPFRAYLKGTSAGAKSFSLNIDEESATGVDVLDMLNDADAEFYDLNGRRISQLQRGINIVKYGNGKTAKVNIK